MFFVYITVNAENYICRAEIAYKSGKTKIAIRYAKRAIELCDDQSKITALRIFMARAYSKLGKIHESNAIYRKLISEKNYLPPVIMGLMYNNFQNTKKANSNLNLIKIFVR